MKEFNINLNQTKTIYELHEEFRKGLGFPDHYGKNLDALWDCITDMETPAIIYLTGAENCPEELEDYISEEIKPIFREAEEKFKAMGKDFKVIWK